MRSAAAFSICLCSVLLTACASTVVTLIPSPQAPVCNHVATALILWAPQWRRDQKDISQREDAAASGLNDFFANAGCFAHAEVRRIADIDPATVTLESKSFKRHIDVVVTVAVLELGPVVNILSSAALVEGGTEVAVQIGVRPPISTEKAREFTVLWRNGGPGVIKGVASLSDDMNAALRSALQPNNP